MRVLLVILTLGFSSPSRSEDLNILTFHVDDTDHEMKLPNDRCLHYLDDTSNFRIQTKSGQVLQVTALGRSDRPATLLIDCPEQSLVYSLVFNARSIHSRDDNLGQPVRPQSSLGLETRTTDRGPGVAEFDLTDRSLDPLQITLRRLEAMNSKTGFSTRSFDADHRLPIERKAEA